MTKYTEILSPTADKRRFGGWSTQGLERFNELCSMVQMARKSLQRRNLELSLWDQFTKEAINARIQRNLHDDEALQDDDEGDDNKPVYMFRDVY